MIPGSWYPVPGADVRDGTWSGLYRAPDCTGPHCQRRDDRGSGDGRTGWALALCDWECAVARLACAVARFALSDKYKLFRPYHGWRRGAISVRECSERGCLGRPRDSGV